MLRRRVPSEESATVASISRRATDSDRASAPDLDCNVAVQMRHKLSNAPRNDGMVLSPTPTRRFGGSTSMYGYESVYILISILFSLIVTYSQSSALLLLSMTIKQNLSARVAENLQGSKALYEGVFRWMSNKYDSVSNVDGIVNLGIAENNLMTEELAAIMKSANTVNPKLFGYGEGPYGSRILREHFANNIFNRYFNPREPIRPDQMLIANGCSGVINNFTFCVCDQGDGVLMTTPYHGGMNPDIQAKSKAKVIPVELGDMSAFDVAQVDLLQQAFDKATQEGIRVRAFVLCNPHNPLGRNYPLEVIIEFLKFASRNQIHVLFDEVYALSIFDYALEGKAKEEQPDQTPFISALSIPNIEDYCERELIHVAYGLSKDFGLNGFRCGCFVSPWNEDILKAMKSIALYSWLSAPAEAMLEKLLEDPKTVDTFTKTNQQRLAECYTITVDALREHNIPYLPAQGGHFIWIDLRKFIPASMVSGALSGDREAEFLLSRAMLDEGVYVSMGLAFAEKKVGFFRVIFSTPPAMLKVGLERMIKACQRIAAE